MSQPSSPELQRNPSDEKIEEKDPFSENYDLVKVILDDRDKLTQRQSARCEEMSYTWVFAFDLVLLIVQIVTSIFYLGSWATFGLVRVPRVAVNIVSKYFVEKFPTRRRKLQFLKAEWYFRLASVLVYVALSLGFCTWLPEKFCFMFRNAFTHLGMTHAKLNSCKWQVFGIRFLFLTLYFPLEILMLVVVRRHTGDQTFNFKLKEALSQGETELQELISEQKAQLGKQTSPKEKAESLRQTLDIESQQQGIPRNLNESSVLNDPNASQRHFLN